MTRVRLRVAVLGAGTVGGEVVRALLDDDSPMGAGLGRRFELVGIAVRDIAAARKRGLPEQLLTDAPAHLVASGETDVIVELMGGAEPAQTLIAATLAAGKPVVTANKQVIAHRGRELEELSRRTGASLRFEAAVGGGIPVLGPLAAGLAANRVERIEGIVNGTTNFILGEMADGGGTYESVLSEAQRRGYAESDPSGDVEGRDAINKLVILARLGFGVWLDPARVVDRPPTACATGRPGISGVTAAEIGGARELGLTLKLLAVATGAGSDDGGPVSAAVLPTLVPSQGALGRTAGVQNRIEVTADPVGLVGFDGPGAGGAATSSAVLGDLVALADAGASTWAGLPEPHTGQAGDPLHDVVREWFTFLPALDSGSLGHIGRLAAQVASTAAGLAIRTCPMTLESVQQGLPEGVRALDAPVYPIR